VPVRVYAIVASTLGRPASARLKRARVQLVRSGKVAAVIADRSAVPPLSERALRLHDAMVRRIARIVPAVLPVRFGTVLQSKAALAAVLDTWSADLLAALALVDDREQMTLRIFARAGQAREPGRTGLPSLASQAGQADDATRPGTAYLKQRAREQADAPELASLRESMAPIVAAERITRHDRGSLILTAYHLIPRGAAPAYRRLLRRYAGNLGGRAVPSGPWPPYAFVPELRR
jgi:hypothetical protein